MTLQIQTVDITSNSVAFVEDTPNRAHNVNGTSNFESYSQKTASLYTKPFQIWSYPIVESLVMGFIQDWNTCCRFCKWSTDNQQSKPTDYTPTRLRVQLQ